MEEFNERQALIFCLCLIQSDDMSLNEATAKILNTLKEDMSSKDILSILKKALFKLNLMLNTKPELKTEIELIIAKVRREYCNIKLKEGERKL